MDRHTVAAGQEIQIRELHSHDWIDWRRLWKAYLKFYDTALAEVVFDTTFARLLSSDSPQINGFIALKDGQPIGLVHYLYHSSTWKIENVCYLQDLYVDETCRGKGVGKALIEAVYKAAEEAGSPSVYWMTQAHNRAARQVYDRIGSLTDFIKYVRPS